MPPPTPGTSTSYRLARITALVLGSLVFLYACERSRSSMLSDVWGEILLAAALGIVGITAAWFEISLSDRAAASEATETGGPREFLLESGDRTIRARIAPSGNLVFHGREISDNPQAHEWSWTFRPGTFPAIRTVLGGGSGELLELLESVVPRLDRHGRHDPGAWVRAHGIAATYRERADNPSRATRKLPILKRGLPREAPPARPVAPERSRTPISGRGDHAATEYDSPGSTPGDDEPPLSRTRLDRARGLLARAVPRRHGDDLDEYDEEFEDDDFQDDDLYDDDLYDDDAEDDADDRRVRPTPARMSRADGVGPRGVEDGYGDRYGADAYDVRGRVGDGYAAGRYHDERPRPRRGG